MWWGLAESEFGGNMESGGQFHVGASGGNLGSSQCEDIFTFIYFIQKLF
jgi:hypothetical protein